MNKFRFRRLMAVLQDRVDRDGKKNPEWLLGYVEGLGTRNLSGYQIGSLINLLLPDSQSNIDPPSNNSSESC